jgi:hypothetical protein
MVMLATTIRLSCVVLLVLFYNLSVWAQEPSPQDLRPRPSPSPLIIIQRPEVTFPAPDQPQTQIPVRPEVSLPKPSPAPSPVPTPINPICGGGTCENQTPSVYLEGKLSRVDLGTLSRESNAQGLAEVLRKNDRETSVKLEVHGLQAGTKYYLYAIDKSGALHKLESVTGSPANVSIHATTKLESFMLLLSPDDDLKALRSETRVTLITTAPESFAWAEPLTRPPALEQSQSETRKSPILHGIEELGCDRENNSS